QITLRVEPALQGQNHSHFAAACNPPHVGRRQGQLHLVTVRIQHAIEGLNQTASLFDRVVIPGVSVINIEVLNDYIEPTLFRAGIIKGSRWLNFPWVDTLIENRVSDVNM